MWRGPPPLILETAVRRWKARRGGAAGWLLQRASTSGWEEAIIRPFGREPRRTGFGRFQRRPQIGLGSSFKGSVEQNEYSGKFVFYQEKTSGRRPAAFGRTTPAELVRPVAYLAWSWAVAAGLRPARTTPCGPGRSGGRGPQRGGPAEAGGRPKHPPSRPLRAGTLGAAARHSGGSYAQPPVVTVTLPPVVTRSLR